MLNLYDRLNNAGTINKPDKKKENKMKKKITKNQVLGFGLAIATPFIIAACDDKPKGDNSCKCPNGTEHENLPCCDGTGCNCTEKLKLVEKSETIDVRSDVTMTIKYMVLDDVLPEWWDTLMSVIENRKGTFLAGHYTLIVESDGDDGFVAGAAGSKTATVSDAFLTASDYDTMRSGIRGIINAWIANVMMNNMIRMADRYDSSQHIVSGIKSV